MLISILYAVVCLLRDLAAICSRRGPHPLELLGPIQLPSSGSRLTRTERLLEDRHAQAVRLGLPTKESTAAHGASFESWS